MSESYENNGYAGDFKRHAPSSAGGGENPAMSDKAGEYLRELLAEKLKIEHAQCPILSRLVNEEITRVQALGRLPTHDSRYIDIYREKPAKVTSRVLVPINDHPKFNFVGKLLGPKGSSMKQLQEETMCKMAILGRGSMKDREKEEEYRQSLDPKYAHLSDELHVEISTIGPPAEAHARMAYALAEVRKYLIPDANDVIRQSQMRQMDMGSAPRLPRPPPPPSATRAVMPAKTKILSILDRARAAMEEQYTPAYEDPYARPEPPVPAVRSSRPPPDYYYSPEYAYDEEYCKPPPSEREYKGSSRGGERRPPSNRYRPRDAPYERHAK